MKQHGGDRAATSRCHPPVSCGRRAAYDESFTSRFPSSLCDSCLDFYSSSEAATSASSDSSKPLFPIILICSPLPLKNYKI